MAVRAAAVTVSLSSSSSGPGPALHARVEEPSEPAGPIPRPPRPAVSRKDSLDFTMLWQILQPWTPSNQRYFGPNFMLYGSQFLHARPISDLLRSTRPGSSSSSLMFANLGPQQMFEEVQRRGCECSGETGSLGSPTQLWSQDKH